MKKYLTAIIIAVLITGIFAGCGRNDKDDKNNDTAEQSVDITDAAEASKDNAEDYSEPVSTNTVGDIPETVSAVEGNDIVDFQLQYSKGLANVTADGEAYALVYDSAAAGSSYYTVFFSDDNGVSWMTKGKNFRETNGSNRFIALDNGDILMFRYCTPAEEAFPELYRITYSNGEVQDEKLDDILDGAVLSDGSKIGSPYYKYEVTYFGGTRFKVDFYDHDPEDYLSYIYIGYIEIDIAGLL